MVFDHIAIRRFIGLIAITLPIIVLTAVWGFPSSISASYHAPTGFPYLPYFPSPRDLFVGSLFVIGAFLMSYKGRQYKLNPERVGAIWQRLGPAAVRFRIWERKHEEDIVSWVGGIAAWVVALFPTTDKSECAETLLFGLENEPELILQQVASIHISFAAILFLTTVYFCLVAFKRRLNNKVRSRGTIPPVWYADALRKRSILYNFSGWTSLLLIIALGLVGFILPNGVCVIEGQTYWAETVMLELFGIAWFTASKPPFLRDPSEREETLSRSSE